MDKALKDLSRMISKDEKVLWFSKPNKKCFILESVFNPFLPFALIWLIIDLLGFIHFNSTLGVINGVSLMLVFFFILHLMPVWIYLGGVLTTFLRYKNTAFIVTTKGVYVSDGVFSKTQEMKPFTEISHISLHRGIFDQILGVGDVLFTCPNISYTTQRGSLPYVLSISDIADYKKVFKMVKDLQTDIYSDTMYPNALRPENNPGYCTKYNKFEEKNIDSQ